MTETTQPDPQVVAWMRGYLADNPAPDGYGAGNKATTMRACRHALGMEIRLRDLADAYAAARKSLTVADIPAGQGPASLFIGADPQDAGTPVVLFKEYDGTLTFIDSYPSEALVEVSAGARAWRDLLTATLPTVTTEEDA